MKKKIILLVICAMIMIGMTACNKNGQSSAANNIDVKNYVYKITYFDEQEELSVDQIVKNSKNAYIYSSGWDEEKEQSTLVFVKVNEDGTFGEKSTIIIDMDSSYNGIYLDEEDNFYSIKNIYSCPDYDDTESGNADYDENDIIDDYYLVKMSLKGEELFSVKLNDIEVLKKLGDENGYFYADNIIVDTDSSIYVNCIGTYAKFDQNGQFQKLITSPENALADKSIMKLENGKIAAITYSDTGVSVSYADMDKGTIGEKFSIPGVSYEYSFYPGIGYDLYLVNSYGLYAYNIGDKDKVQLMSYIDSDLGFYEVYSVTGIDKNNFYAVYDDDDNGTRCLGKFTKVDPKDVKDKKIITLAMAYSDWNVRTEVIAFNKENEDYRIKILDYSSLYNTENDDTIGITKLNTDIVSGKTPDIIILENRMPLDSYINKGILEDLKPYIEKDTDLDINNYMPNIIDAFSKNGKLYSLVPSYSIDTLVAKTSDVGDKSGWTIGDVKKILENKGGKTVFLQSMTKEMIIRNSLNMASNQFIDLETGKCSFNSEDFIELLEFAKTFPDEIDPDQYTDEYWNNYDSMWREGKVLASSVNFGDFSDYNHNEKGTFGEKITIIGFPSNTGDGSAIMPNLQLAMSNKSKNKDGAWTFLKRFITDEYQNSDKYWGFPLSIKRLDVLAQEATQKPYYLDSDGTKVEYDDTYYINDLEIPIAPMSKEDAEALKQELYTFTEVYNENEAVLKIIFEEAGPYFNDQKSAKDVADIIQSRAQIYVNENR